MLVVILHYERMTMEFRLILLCKICCVVHSNLKEYHWMKHWHEKARVLPSHFGSL